MMPAIDEPLPERGTMHALTACLEALDRLQHPSSLSFRRDGKALAATVSPASREARQSHASRIWRFDLDGNSEQLASVPAAMRSAAIRRWMTE